MKEIARRIEQFLIRIAGSKEKLRRERWNILNEIVHRVGGRRFRR